MKLSVIIPTLNERDNIGPLVDALDKILTGIDWEMIFVDDNSHDGTIELIEALKQKDQHVRCVKRCDRHGISSACIDGMNKSKAAYMAVMDADLQHDPKAIGEMLLFLEQDDLDLVIASRYVKGSSIRGWPISRILMSYTATALSCIFVGRGVKDPLSGFFMVKRSLFEDRADHLCSLGSKILMSLLICRNGPLKIKEIPFNFKPRYTGLSKHNPRLVWENCLIVLNGLTRHP